VSEHPLISIVTINWNSIPVTVEFLRSIRSSNTYHNIEVIVVDNCSVEDPTNALKVVYPDVKVVLHPSNAGFGGGNNVGIGVASGEYVFIVNNDTEFTPGLLEGLLDIFRKYPDAGIVCPKFRFFFEQGVIEYAGYKKVNPFTGRNSMVGHGEEDQGQYDDAGVTNYAHGGAMLIPMRVIREAGLMPEQFFLYYEELDWSEQLKRKGFRIYYQPNSLIYHKESMTTGKSSPLKTYYLTRNRILFMRRNAPWQQLLVFLAYFSLVSAPKNTIQFWIRGQRQHLRSFWRGIAWQFNRNIGFKQ
jgi:GT2 family glycosyltransferase